MLSYSLSAKPRDEIHINIMGQMSSAEAAVPNQWDQVDDFKWLKAEHSPNWSELPGEQRLKEDIWTAVVPGGPGVGLDDILKKIGIAGR